MGDEAGEVGGLVELGGGVDVEDRGVGSGFGAGDDGAGGEGGIADGGQGSDGGAYGDGGELMGLLTCFFGTSGVGAADGGGGVIDRGFAAWAAVGHGDFYERFAGDGGDMAAFDGEGLADGGVELVEPLEGDG